MKISVLRYNPEQHEKPFMQDYNIELVASDRMFDTGLQIYRRQPGQGD